MSTQLQLIPTKDELQTLERITEHAAKSGFFSKLGGQPGIMCIGLYARELGQPPMQMICGGMHNIMGKIEIAPVTMNAMIRRAGHSLKILECDGQKCVIKGIRSDTKDEYTCTYTFDDAKRAGLVKSGGGWEKNPSDMCFARCLSRLARRLFPDVIGPSYGEGEISERVVDKTTSTSQSEPSSIDTIEIEESAPIVENEANPADQLISAENAKMLDDTLIPFPEILSRILKAYKIERMSQLKEKDFPVVKARLDEIFNEMDNK
jgi:hypothetical protein